MPVRKTTILHITLYVKPMEGTTQKGFLDIQSIGRGNVSSLSLDVSLRRSYNTPPLLDVGFRFRFRFRFFFGGGAGVGRWAV